MPTLFLTDDAIREIAPSVFATEPHKRCSSVYKYIPTSEVVSAFRKEGFAPVKVEVSRTRMAETKGFEKHLLRFRRMELNNVALGGLIPEIVLVNSHDGTSSYRMLAGLYRLVCLNGLCVEDQKYGEVRVRHQGDDIVRECIEASHKVLESAVAAVETANQWGRIMLEHEEQLSLATHAHLLRFGDSEGNTDTPITPAQLLIPRREQDKKNDLWTTFNTIQENTLKGGLSNRGPTSTGAIRRSTTREVTNIDFGLQLNRALWKLSDHLACLRSRN